MVALQLFPFDSNTRRDRCSVKASAGFFFYTATHQLALHICKKLSPVVRVVL